MYCTSLESEEGRDLKTNGPWAGDNIVLQEPCCWALLAWQGSPAIASRSMSWAGGGGVGAGRAPHMHPKMFLNV